MNYSKYADLLESMPVNEPREIKCSTFNKIAKERKFTFIRIIDTKGIYKREIWGNRGFNVIVKHNTETNGYIII